MWQPHVFVVLFFLLSLYGKGADCQHPGYTLNAHRLVWVESGLCVEIPCKFTVPANRPLSTSVTGIWRKTDTPDIVAASTEASKVSEGTKGRFTLTGKVQEGDCSFSISNAQPADQGEYEFRIEDGSDGYSYSQYRLSVSVTESSISLTQPSDSPSNKIKVSGADCQHGYTLNAQSVSVASGLCVEIPCTFTVPAGSTLSTLVTGIWKRTDTPDIVAASTNASMVSEGTKGRFTLTGKVQEGDCSFSISNAQPADQGEYVFRIEDVNTKYSYSSYRLRVTVTDSPSIKIKVADLPEPTISPGGELIAGKPITLTCTAHPAPQGCKGNITWGGRIKMTKLYNYKQEDQAGKSIISFTPSQREHNSPLTCTVTYSGVSTNSSITLKVQYSPSIKIRVSGYNGTYENKSLTITEGDSVNISCYVKSRPMADISCGEGQGYNVIKAPRERVLVLQNVSVADGVTYTCLARNTHGSVSETVSVTVEYAPRSSFISNCTSEGCRVEAIEGTSLSLLCSAESNPPANLSWAKTGQNSTDPLNSSSGRLDVSHVTTDNGGDYMCRARNKHGNSTVSITVVILCE
ncbi:sialic acid-binding Ig-like lectin 13 [Xenopus tropicalis]|uniref:Sialic acid-binding Ig-like lectin 13 n=1 Tax=Xenopus tropicalis TaxID=8364 RepID=A0A8J1JX01_XENTR|nr:sialic acid-binding Ig-like lectin 13 [Xenopus tropicalis]